MARLVVRTDVIGTTLWMCTNIGVFHMLPDPLLWADRIREVSRTSVLNECAAFAGVRSTQVNFTTRFCSRVMRCDWLAVATPRMQRNS